MPLGTPSRFVWKNSGNGFPLPPSKTSAIKKSIPKLKYHFIYYLTKGEDGNNYGIATFSKFPIVNKGFIKFENTANLSMFCDIKINQDTIRIYNNHLQKYILT